MNMRVHKATETHKAFRDDAIALLKTYSGHLSAMEMLALSAHLVGQIVAMQDQRTMSPEAAMNIVSENIEAGNREVLDGLASPSNSTPA